MLDQTRSIPATQQFRAVAWLRWRLYRNGFRRKGGKGELVARIIAVPFVAVILLGVLTGSFAAGYGAAANNSLSFITGLFWVIFALQIVVSINVSPPGLSFDPEALIRYPLTFSRYLLIRLFLGLLSASTILGSLALLAAAAGIVVARPSLALAAFAAALALAVTNMLFTRMIFAWVDRWLSTRRAREFFTGFIILFSIGIQYLNVTFNGVGKHISNAERAAKIRHVVAAYHRVEPLFRFLPPSLAGRAIVRASLGQPLAALALLASVLLFAAAFLSIFSWRMRREYRGENLSEVNRSRPAETPVRVGLISPAAAGTTSHADAFAARHEVTQARAPHGILPPAVTACLYKEWIYIRRNPTQFYGLLAPLAMVFLFAGRMGRFASTGLIFPAAAAYSILGVAALAYNVLGLDANGIQFYFLAPVQFRTVFLAKNIFAFGITALQLLILYVLLTFTSGRPSFLITVSTLCWVAFAALVNVTVGNMRSLTAPKKIDPAKISRRQASQLSALLSLGIMLVIGGMGAGLIFMARLLGIDWLPIPILLVLAVGAFALYWAGLNRVDSIALSHRETLIEELSKIE